MFINLCFTFTAALQELMRKRSAFHNSLGLSLFDTRTRFHFRKVFTRMASVQHRGDGPRAGGEMINANSHFSTKRSLDVAFAFYLGYYCMRGHK